MTPEQIEEILEGQAETQNIDFKRSCNWSADTFAKDILAMSNVQSGGLIIIGVEDKTFSRTGVTPEAKATYVTDTMKDQLTSFADPHVDFSVSFPVDKEGKEYVVITIQEFEELPVFCLKTSEAAGTKAGVIYYRNKNRRAESAAVSNAYDMRSVIELATVKKLRSWKKIGLSPNSTAEQQHATDLEGL